MVHVALETQRFAIAEVIHQFRISSLRLDVVGMKLASALPAPLTGEVVTMIDRTTPLAIAPILDGLFGLGSLVGVMAFVGTKALTAFCKSTFNFERSLAVLAFKGYERATAIVAALNTAKAAPAHAKSLGCGVKRRAANRAFTILSSSRVGAVAVWGAIEALAAADIRGTDVEVDATADTLPGFSKLLAFGFAGEGAVDALPFRDKGLSD